MVKRLIMVSGASGVGKGTAISRLKQEFGFVEFFIRKTKTARHEGNEAGLGFKGAAGNYIMYDCRGSEHRIYLDELKHMILKNDLVITEGYYQLHDFYRHGLSSMFFSEFNIPLIVSTVFISSFSKDSIRHMKKNGTYTNTVFKNTFERLLKRARDSGKVLNKELYSELTRRAIDSIPELDSSKIYDHFLVNLFYDNLYKKMNDLIGH